ncbi:MAG: hypothetical protein P8175_16535 [Deltaproteobacteria bacterium]
MDPVGGFAEHGPFQQFAAHNKRYSADQEGYPHQTRIELGTNGVKPPRGKPRGILKRMAELSIAISPPSLKLRRALLAIHPRALEAAPLSGFFTGCKQVRIPSGNRMPLIQTAF